MIRKNSALSVLPIAQALTEQNVAVSPKPGTVLSELFKWSMGTMEPKVATEDHELETILTNSDVVVAEGMSGHGAVIDREVTNTAKVLAHQLKYSKDTAKVLLDSTFETISAEVNASASTDIDIVEISMRDIYLTDSFASLMENYADGTYTAIKCVSIKITETPNEEALLEFVRTGSVGFDTLVGKVLASKPTGWLEKVFTDNFTGEWKGPKEWNEATSSEVLVYKPALEYLDETLMVFLLCVGMEESPVSGFNGNLLRYRELIAGIARATAVSMILTVSNFNRQVALGNLVIDTPSIDYIRYSARGAVNVSAKLYHEFLEGGGTPEALIGVALTTSHRPYTLKDIMSRQVEMVSNYQKSCRERDRRAQENLIEYFGHEAQMFFHGFIHNTAKFDYAVMDEYTDANSGYHDLVNNVFNDITPKRWGTEPYLALREMFNRILWRGTNVDELLSIIDREMGKHGDLEPREAAYRATIDILLSHYLKQVDIERLKV